MRIAILVACGLPILASCSDSARGPTEPLPSAVDVPTSSVKTDKGRDVVSGVGTFIGVSFTVSAHSGLLGEKPKGRLSLSSEGHIFQEGKVLCMAVAGNHAAVGIEHNLNPTGGVFLIVEDNGSPSSGVPDRATLLSGAAADQAGCLIALVAFGSSGYPVDGDVLVEDALPAGP